MPVCDTLFRIRGNKIVGVLISTLSLLVARRSGSNNGGREANELNHPNYGTPSLLLGTDTFGTQHAKHRGRRSARLAVERLDHSLIGRSEE